MSRDRRAWCCSGVGLARPGPSSAFAPVRGAEGAGEGERAGASRAFSQWGRLSRGRRNVAPGPGLTPAELALAAILGVHEVEVVTESHGSL